MQRQQSPLDTSTQSRGAKPHDKRYVSPSHGQQSRSVSPQQQLPSQRPQIFQNQVIQSGPPTPLQSNLSRHSADNSFQSQNPASYLYIPCPSHPDLFITNICKSRECVEPLCPECITNHLDMHQRKGQPQAKIENIQRVRKECCQLLFAQVDRLRKDSTDLRNHSIGSQQTHYQTCLDTMRQQHQRILDMIDDHFEQMEKELKDKMRGLDQLKKQYQDLDNLVQEDIRQIESFTQQLQGQNYVRLVIQLLEEEQVLLGKKKITDLEKAIQQYEDQLPLVQADSNSYEHLRNEIKKVCFISTRQQLAAKAPRPTKADESLARSNRHQIDSQGKTKKLLSYNDSSILPVSNILSHIPEVNTQQGPHDGNEFYIDTANHFKPEIQNEEKALVSFEEDTKKMHVFYLYDQECKIQSSTLNIDFRIPVNHRQITNSKGVAFITGGVYREKQRFKASDLVYRLELDEMTLKQCPSMNVARAMHTLCQVGDYIYAMGGTQTNDENSSINKCERMDLATLRWTPIADSKHKTSGSCLVGYRDKYILKIGGKVDIFTPCTAIEVYEIARDYWTELDYQFSGAGYLRLPFNAAAVDIGQRKILVFGGSVHDVKSNESSIIQLNEQLTVPAQITTTRSIPRPIEFSTQTVITDENNIWTFCDVGGKKRILFGSDSVWKEY